METLTILLVAAIGVLLAKKANNDASSIVSAQNTGKTPSQGNVIVNVLPSKSTGQKKLPPTKKQQAKCSGGAKSSGGGGAVGSAASAAAGRNQSGISGSCWAIPGASSDPSLCAYYHQQQEYGNCVCAPTPCCAVIGEPTQEQQCNALNFLQTPSAQPLPCMCGGVQPEPVCYGTCQICYIGGGCNCGTPCYCSSGGCFVGPCCEMSCL